MKSFAQLAVALCGLFAIGGSLAAAQDLPTTWSWTSTGVLISPASDSHDIVAVKDPSTVYYNGQYLVYASTVNSSGDYGMEYLHFANWSDAPAASASPYYLDYLGGTAPQLFYFAPQNKWYLIYQWTPQFSTNSDPTQPQNWTSPQNFFATKPSNINAWLDFWVICDSANCYLFFCDDGGQFWESKTPIGDFPNGFGTPVLAYSEAEAGNLFEADNVYNVAGTGDYLADVECYGGPSGHRFFRALWATNLAGPWQPLGDTLNFNTPFLGTSNITWDSGQWTDDISSGGGVITGGDQTDTIDLNNLTFLYQGDNPNANAPNYNAIPWRLGLATSTSGGTGPCEPTPIDAQMNVGGVWTAESSANVTSTTAVVDLGPQPLTGGSWSWSGPNGFTSASREIDDIKLSVGTNVYTATYTNSCGSKSTQAFTITVSGGPTTFIANGTYIVTAVNSGSALDDPDFSKTDGEDMGIWTVNDGTNQQWTVTNVSSNVITLTNVSSGQLLDVAGASKLSGALVDQWLANGQTNQEWNVISLGGGAYELTSVNSGLALSVVGGGTANGTGVDQLTYSGSTSQQWKFAAF
jgi:hypothetical protein